MNKVTENPAPAQGESRAVRLEKALLWKEVQRIHGQIEPHIVAIVRAFPRHKIGKKTAGKIGSEIGTLIGYGIAQDRPFTDESVFGANHLCNQFEGEDLERLVSSLIDAFLKRVDEIGQIAEDAASRVEG